MRARVLKFGGSSFRTLEDFRSVASLLVRMLQEPGTRLVVVVSAMYGETDRLLQAGTSLNDRMSGQARDALITTGEVISASLLRVALESLDVSVVSLNGHQCGIRSDSNFTKARICEVDPRPLRRALGRHQVVVVTGAQAVDANGWITMLGRNSSDLTAVAIAAALGVGTCEILSDVPGVYSGDPYIHRDARLLPRLSLDQLIDMSISGAKVIHHGAASYARNMRCRILCRATRDPDVVGTIVDTDAPTAPAVVIHERAQVFLYESSSAAEHARHRLAQRGVPSVVASHGSGYVMVCSRADLVSELDFTDGALPRRLDAHAMITTFDAGGVHRRIVPFESARAIGTYLHSRLSTPADRTPIHTEPIAPLVLNSSY
jgi:aspartate kinase